MCLCVSLCVSVCLCVCSVNKDGGQSDPHRQEVRDGDQGHVKSTPNIQLEAAAAAVGGGAATASLPCYIASSSPIGRQELIFF